jgi:hypothetical protein
MIRHLVMWEPSDKAFAEGLAQSCLFCNASAKTMEGKIAGLRNIEIRLNLVEGEAYRFVLYSEFDGLEDLAAYKEHPLHVAHRERIKPYVKSRLGLDIEA